MSWTQADVDAFLKGIAKPNQKIGPFSDKFTFESAMELARVLGEDAPLLLKALEKMQEQYAA